MIYKMGDLIETQKGTLYVQCPFHFKENTNPKYDKLGGKTLYWLQDELGNDVFYWKDELKQITIKEKNK